MNVGQVILGRPWLFEKNVTIYSRSNMCQFEHGGKQIKLLLLRPKTGQPKQTSTLALLPTPLSQPRITTVFSPSFTSYAYHVTNRFLHYCRHHLTIEHSSLRLHLHYIM